jgi:hypothetical protein
MRPDCERHQQELLSGALASPRADHEPCDDCGSFWMAERLLAPPDDLVLRTLDRLRPALLERSARRFGIYWGLTLAGALSLPIIVALNVGMIWMSYVALAWIATTELALAGASLLAASLLLALSVAYGSLPLLASWGLQLRERTL